MAQPGMFSVGEMYYGGKLNGWPFWSQPLGPGTLVYPQFPSQYPVQPEVPQSFPQTPFVYWGMLVFGCGHWLNCPEVFKVYNPYSQQLAALICCPMCSFIQEIIEPAEDWWSKFYLTYNQGLETGVRPTW